MTIYVDPYHTSAGVTLDMTRTVTPLKECTVRDSLTGTNLGVRPSNGIIPVFITGSRDSEKSIPSFTHPILIKNFNTKSYLFTDMTLFVSSGATIETLDRHIRRREEFEFTKTRAIASLAWAAGETDMFQSSFGFVSDVFANWMGQTIARNFALTFVDQVKVQLLAFAYYESLYHDGPVDFSRNTEVALLTAKKASEAFRTPFTQVLDFYKSLTVPMSSAHDFCEAVVTSLDNINLNPIPGRPETGFNFRVLLNLIADAWYSTNSKLILAVALEHPPTMAAIIYYCANYSNFKRQQLSTIIQQVARGGKGEKFNTSFKTLIENYRSDAIGLRPVMEYLDPSHSVIDPEDTELQALMKELNEDDGNQMNKIVETSEGTSFGTEPFSNNQGPSAVEGTLNAGGSDPNSPAPLNSDDVVDGRPIM